MRVLFYFILILVIIAFPSWSDRLPNATVENQIIGITTNIDVIGMVTHKTFFGWSLSSGILGEGELGPDERIASVVYDDSLITNGGHLMINSEFNFDSGDKEKGLYNLETDKVITYESVGGSHLMADESITLDTAGNYSQSDNNLRCVFSAGSSSIYPGFCNSVNAKSSLVNVNSAQISTSSRTRAVSSDTAAPAALGYSIDITRNPESGLEYAIATAKVEFSIGSMEGRDDDLNWNKTASTNRLVDKSEATGGIIYFSMAYEYESGLGSLF